MAAAVSLKRARFNWDMGGLQMALRLELMAALDLKSAHWSDHSDRVVSKLELHCTPHRPCLGWAFGVQPRGLQRPKSLVLKTSSFSRCWLRLHTGCAISQVMVLGHCQQAKLFSFPSAWTAGGQLQLVKGGCVGPRSMGTDAQQWPVGRRACWPGWGRGFNHSERLRGRAHFPSQQPKGT